MFTIKAAERQGIQAAGKAEYPGRMKGGQERYSLFRQQKGRVFRQQKRQDIQAAKAECPGS